MVFDKGFQFISRFDIWVAAQINCECRSVALENLTVRGMPESVGDIRNPFREITDFERVRCGHIVNGDLSAARRVLIAG